MASAEILAAGLEKGRAKQVMGMYSTRCVCTYLPTYKFIMQKAF